MFLILFCNFLHGAKSVLLGAMQLLAESDLAFCGSERIGNDLALERSDRNEHRPDNIPALCGRIRSKWHNIIFCKIVIKK